MSKKVEEYLNYILNAIELRLPDRDFYERLDAIAYKDDITDEEYSFIYEKAFNEFREM